MKLLCVIDSLGSGGAQRQLVNIACGLKECGHEVEFFTYYPGDHFKSQLDQIGIPVHLHLKASRFSLRPIVGLRRLIRRGRFNSVLAFLETPAVYAELACLGLGKVRLVVGERSTVPHRRTSIGRTLKSHLHRLSHAVVANSHAQRDWLAANFGFLEPKLHCIWNGIDVRAFRPSPQRPSSSGTLRLLGVGRLSQSKNLMRLASGLGICLQQGLSVTLDWVGRVEDEDYYQMMVGVVRDLGLDNTMTWLGERRDVPDLMRRYDALILPSLWVGVRQLLVHSAGSDGLTMRFSGPPTLGFSQNASYTDLCRGTCARD